MRIIDLYYKIVMKEELPKQIKYKNKVYHYDDEIELNPYVSRKGTYSEYLIGATLYQCPTAEIEIIEEEKNIEHYDYCDNPDVMSKEIIAHNFVKLNEDLDVIVREINRIKKEGK